MATRLIEEVARAEVLRGLAPPGTSAVVLDHGVATAR
jgi:hypothetical protein